MISTYADLAKVSNKFKAGKGIVVARHIDNDGAEFMIAINMETSTQVLETFSGAINGISKKPIMGNKVTIESYDYRVIYTHSFGGYNMERIAFVMQLKSGCEQEYKKRHDEIWPELVSELKQAGIEDYSIFLHADTMQLFGVLKRTKNHKMAMLPLTPIMQKWWAFMGDIMEHNDDNSPVATDLKEVFYLE